MSDPLLSVRDLKRHYPIRGGWLRRVTGQIRAVDGVSFDLRRGETLGLVGESGCGKSTVARSALGLEPPTEGTVAFDGDDVADHSRGERTAFRRRAGIVFQDPASSFDPRMTVGESVAEPMAAHGLGAERRADRVDSLLETVGLDPADGDRYPHELSGGQKQRAALARALSLSPDLLVLDEPVSALDVSVQAEILALVAELQEAFDLAVLLVSHDMSVVSQLCDRVAVMYLGEIVERGPADALFDDPAHPYTEALLSAVPAPDPDDRLEDAALDGEVPDPSDPPSGCRFHTRCPSVIPPDDAAVDDGTFRAGFALRVALRNGNVGARSVRERLADGGDPDDVSRSAVRAAIREEYGLPPELDADPAERAVADALDAVAAGDPDAAAERLSDRFHSICEREPPTNHGSGEREVACHLHRQSAEADAVAGRDRR
ncbi:ABC transporter ATP-binding protein [Halostella litorea]|uniref:ABC transporter ATP-binding protein n=1 Tax=Halostella litorea TaxID=2528831 RepID=UPI0010933410|nr:ABC transporter ATP-binding protein [Halostella litorea]